MLYDLFLRSYPVYDDTMLYGLLRVLWEEEFRAFAAAVLAFSLVVFCGKRTIRWLIGLKVQDNPEFHNADLNALMADRRAIPTMGGVLIAGAILVSTLALASLSEPYVHLAIVAVVGLAAVGGADDWLKLTTARRQPGSRAGLYAWEKLLFQLGIGAVIGVFLLRYGGDHATILVLPFQRTYDPESITRGMPVLESGVIHLPPWLFVISTMLLVAMTSNAVNLTDGMDGLAPGTVLIASLGLMVLCAIAASFDTATRLNFPHVAPAKELFVVTGAMAGACLGFLWFNCHPAQVFMGDTGSLMLGGLLAYVAIAVRQEVLLMVIGGVFFLEMASVIIQVGYFKWTKGRRVFRMAPIHHHFHLGGWSHPQVVTRFWVLGAACAMAALVSLKLR